jgi:hypothetical protein
MLDSTRRIPHLPDALLFVSALSVRSLAYHAGLSRSNPSEDEASPDVGLPRRKSPRPPKAGELFPLFLAEFLEARIISERIEHWIESEQRGSERCTHTQCTPVGDRE